MDDFDYSSDSSSDSVVATGGRRSLLNKIMKKEESFEAAEVTDAAESDGDTKDQNKTSKDQSKTGQFRNKQRVLITAGRGLDARLRHLLKDIHALIPHSKKDSKLKDINELQEISDLEKCNNALYMEGNKDDAYLWLGKTVEGPSVKFALHSIQTVKELKSLGNCLKGSRPFLVFTKEFDTKPEFAVVKQLLHHTFNTPRKHRKSKPFFDHVLLFCYLDSKIYVRHYQIVKQEVVEIGPRFVLNPIRIFGGSFGGMTLFHNKDYVSNRNVRISMTKEKGMKYGNRLVKDTKRKGKEMELEGALKTELDVVDNVFKA
ncbi:hypothetical protein MP638_001732 [Amoeboaphelidium occidentale]|nr:hypothetical protein MP638_001732 [Amoeboaphelidium occidentale]